MGYTGRSVLSHFGALRSDQISTADCRAYTAARRASGRSKGTAWTELGHLASILPWAAKARLIDRASHIERPAKPMPKERFLSDAEIARLLAVDMAPHIRLAILLMLTTAGRTSALLQLTWDRVDMVGSQINLRIDMTGPRKGRAVVPINDTLMAALTVAAEGAVSDHVIEWCGKPVKSIRTGFDKAAAAAGMPEVTPHTLRHTAAVRMAGAGIPMSKISQFLGHSNTQVTERVYARYAPDHLADAADALEIVGLRVVK